VFVGDDSLNRAIASARKIAAETAPGLFDIEAIPRTGYRLTGTIVEFVAPGDEDDTASPVARVAPAVSRRALVAGGVAAAIGAGGAGMWWLKRPAPDPRFDALMQRGEDALRVDEPAAKYFEQAVAAEPHDARAWGLLAYSLGSGGGAGTMGISGATAQAAERAARKALKIDPDEPNALLTMTTVEIGMLDWFSRENELRRILKIDPDNTLVMRFLGTMLHGVGRCRESLAVVERALSIDPLVVDHQCRKALRLWVLGRVADGDRVIDRAMQLWPSHTFVRLARLMMYAFTGRTHAALAMVEDEENSPRLLSPAAVSVWRSSLTALENRTPAAVAAARSANLEGARTTPAIASQAILFLSALGELDAAFEVANGFLLSRGSLIVRPRPTAKVPTVNGPGWRNTFGLFTPPTKPMRLDRRFGSLCDGLGLTDYWRKGGIGPDAFLMRA
jgi:tetratricopeptide (TPR) repeat protein